MKKVILGSVLAVAAVTANATTASQQFCSGGSNQAAQGAAAVGGATDNNFVKVAFTPRCSSNISLTAVDGGVYYAVGSGSTKGKTSFRGSSAGGGIVSNATCATTGCTTSDAQTAAQSTANLPSS